jgi:glycolate oxidase
VHVHANSDLGANDAEIVSTNMDAVLPKGFSPALLGVTPQGWMRQWDAENRVSRAEWKNPEPLLKQAGVIVISREDVNGDDELIEHMAHQTQLLVVTEATVRLVPKPLAQQVVMASFDDIERAGEAVAAVIAAGIIPAGMEMMDKPATAAVEPFVHAGYDLEAEAIMLVESDGTPEEVNEEIRRIKAVLEANGATRLAVSQSEAERLRFWAGRKAAFPAVGRISPDYYCMDGTIPRKRLGEVLKAIGEMERKYQLRCANVFHAGDGNLHPLIMFDANDPDSVLRAERFGFEILELSIAVGGTVTGEHGVGVEKIHQLCQQFDAPTLEAFFAVKRAFDPPGLLNPGKAIPSLVRCAEYGKIHVHGGALKFPELPRF